MLINTSRTSTHSVLSGNCRSALAAISCLLLFASVSSVALSDTIFGLHGSAHLWKPEPTGTIGQRSNSFNLAQEFSDDTADSSSLLVAVEHPIPLVPNVQLRRTPLTWDGTAEAASGTLGGLFVFSNEPVDATLDMTLLDGTLYYELLDNWVTLDLGVTARQLDGFFAITRDGGDTDRVVVDEVIPMLYGHARFDLPFTGLAVGLRGNGMSYKDSNLTDVEAYLHLEVDLLPLVDVGIQGGLRRLGLDIDDIDSWNSDAALEGAYVALTGHF